MKSKIKLSLVLSICLSLSFAFGQSTTNNHKINVNHSSNYHSIENKKTFKLQLDSLIGKKGEERFKGRWNYRKNKITEEVFDIVGNENNPVKKTEMIYNDSGLIKVEFKYAWKEELKQYQPMVARNDSKTEFIYDDNGNNLFKYQYSWSTSKESFLPCYKEEFKYNKHGNKILHLQYKWNSELEKFDVLYKAEYKYDEVGKIIESNWYDFKSYKNDFRDGFFLDSKHTFTYSELLDRQFRKGFSWDYDAGKMLLLDSREVRYSFKENKKFSIKNHIWEDGVLKNKHDNKILVYSPSFIDLCENDISTASFFSDEEYTNKKYKSNYEYEYDSYGICVLRNSFFINEVTSTKYKSNIEIRTILVDDEKNLIYHYIDSDYDLDFNNWEIDKEWIEYYSKVEK